MWQARVDKFFVFCGCSVFLFVVFMYFLQFAMFVSMCVYVSFHVCVVCLCCAILSRKIVVE